MRPQQLFLLAALMLLGALVSAIVPEHPLFNLPEGKVVLSSFGLLAGLTGLILWLIEKRGQKKRQVP